MPRILRRSLPVVLLTTFTIIAFGGCTSVREYFGNGLKVGPNYKKPAAPVAEQWIDSTDVRLRKESGDLSQWWTVFNDATLNQLVVKAYRQNLTLREAGFRVLEARAQLAITRGEFFPQNQSVSGSYSRNANGQNYTNSWSTDFSLGWEIDFWGRLRRAIASSSDQLDASVESYDDVLVTLLSDIASNYVDIRTSQERLRLLEDNVKVQQDILDWMKAREEGGKLLPLDIAQSTGNLEQSIAGIHSLNLSIRQSMNRLCILLGMPPEEIESQLGPGEIPQTPPEVVVGMPAELLRRRPDIRRAERNVAAQAERIGIAQAALYPTFSLNGSLGYSANDFGDLFSPNSFGGRFGPSFNWNILNYGRIINNVRYQDAAFQELVVTYQNAVLTAQEEAENGIITYLQSQERKKHLDISVDNAVFARDFAAKQFMIGGAGTGDFNRFAVIQQNLISQQDAWAQARGNIAQGLIQVYKALGGGWQIRLLSEEVLTRLPPVQPTAPEPTPAAKLETQRPNNGGAIPTPPDQLQGVTAEKK